MVQQPFSGLNIAICGFFGKEWTKEKLKLFIKNNGGSIVDYKDKTMTHLLTTKGAFHHQAFPVQEAIKRKNVKLVNFDWFEDSLQARSKKRVSKEYDVRKEYEEHRRRNKQRARVGAAAAESSKNMLNFAQIVHDARACYNVHGYKIYTDPTGFAYDVTFTRSDAFRKHTEKVVLRIYESEQAVTTDIKDDALNEADGDEKSIHEDDCHEDSGDESQVSEDTMIDISVQEGQNNESDVSEGHVKEANNITINTPQSSRPFYTYAAFSTYFSPNAKEARTVLAPVDSDFETAFAAFQHEFRLRTKRTWAERAQPDRSFLPDGMKDPKAYDYQLPVLGPIKMVDSTGRDLSFAEAGDAADSDIEIVDDPWTVKDRAKGSDADGFVTADEGDDPEEDTEKPLRQHTQSQAADYEQFDMAPKPTATSSSEFSAYLDMSTQQQSMEKLVQYPDLLPPMSNTTETLLTDFHAPCRSDLRSPLNTVPGSYMGYIPPNLYHFARQDSADSSRKQFMEPAVEAQPLRSDSGNDFSSPRAPADGAIRSHSNIAREAEHLPPHFGDDENSCPQARPPKGSGRPKAPTPDLDESDTLSTIEVLTPKQLKKRKTLHQSKEPGLYPLPVPKPARGSKKRTSKHETPGIAAGDHGHDDEGEVSLDHLIEENPFVDSTSDQHSRGRKVKREVKARQGIVDWDWGGRRG